MADTAAHNRSKDAEHDRPEHRHVHVHYRFRDIARDQPDNNVPDQVKHSLSSSSCFQGGAEYNPGVSFRMERLKNLSPVFNLDFWQFRRFWQLWEMLAGEGACGPK